MTTPEPELDVVTGAFGYTGKYITSRLLTKGRRVLTLTGHGDRPSPFEQPICVAPFNFDQPGALVESLRGAATLYNTYWIRFPYGGMTYDRAVENSLTLIKAAQEAGIRRIVHISIMNASERSPLPYFKGKALVEKAIMASGLSYAIIRPTVIFGPEGILINNIAWLIRRFPIFAAPGSGDYKLQPIYVEDVAEIAVSAAKRDDNEVVEAIGPEIYTFNGLVRLIAEVLHRRTIIVDLPPGIALQLSQWIGRSVSDVVLTEDEVKGLIAGLLVGHGSPTGQTRLSDWLKENAARVGIKYMSELQRHYR
ncbi:MAG: epimerase [Chloroflexota bacterium]|nr:MAG: epimerase [Chloroflexota bacterium]